MRVKTLLILFAVIAIPFAGIFYGLQRRSAWIAEIERRAGQDVVTKRQLIRDVDAVCAALGRPPQDQAELEQHLGQPLPHVHDNGRPTPIYYWPETSSYKLQYELWATDDWIYDSAHPDAGWVQRFY